MRTNLLLLNCINCFLLIDYECPVNYNLNNKSVVLSSGI